MKKNTLFLLSGLIILIAVAGVGYNSLKAKVQNNSSEKKVESSTENSTQKAEGSVAEDNSKNGADKNTDENAQKTDDKNTDNNGKDTDSSKAEKKPNAKNTNQPAAPNFTVFDLDGNKVNFEDMKGKPVVINFWASWCHYCVAEMDGFQKVYDEYKGKDVVFMMVNATDGQMETKEKAVKYIKDNGYTMPFYIDEALSGKDGLDVSHSANGVYGVSSYPTTIFINSEGNIAGGAPGMLNEDQFRKLVEFVSDDANIGRPIAEALS